MLPATEPLLFCKTGTGVQGGRGGPCVDKIPSDREISSLATVLVLLSLPVFSGQGPSDEAGAGRDRPRLGKVD